MANYTEAAQKFIPVLDEVYSKKLITSILDVAESKVEFDLKDVGVARIFVTLVDGLGNYVRANHAATSADAAYADYNGNNYSGSRDGYPIGNSTGYWQSFKLRFLRGVQFKIDYADNEESFSMQFGSTISELVRTKVIPEIDETRFATMVDACNATAGNLVSANISDNQIVAAINTGLEYIEDIQADELSYVLFVSTAVMKLIRSTTELNKYITVENFTNEKGIDFTLTKYNGIPLIEVPKARFFTKPVLDQHNGFHPGATSYLINFILCPLGAGAPIVKLDDLRVFGDDVVTDFKGYLCNYLLWHDFLIPENKKPGFYAHVSQTAASGAVNTVAPVLVEGSVSGATKYEGHLTKPAGLNGHIIYSESTAFAVGTSYTADGSTNIALEKGEEFSLTGTTAKFALIDGNGVAVAVSGSITVPKKS